jgi:hypothetical protein
MAVPAFGEQLLTTDSLATYAGLTAMVFGFTNAIKVAFGFDPKPLGLAISIIVCLVASFYAQQTTSAPPIGGAAVADPNRGPIPNEAKAPTPNVPLPLRILLALANACLIYLTAQGATSAGNAVVDRPKVGAQAAPKPTVGTGTRVSLLRQFFRPW